MLDAILGGLLMHYMATPPARIETPTSADDTYAETLVGMLLASVARV